MATYDIKVTVEYQYEVEADTYEQAEQEGWNYENYSHFAEVYSIEIDEQPEDEEEDEN